MLSPLLEQTVVPYLADPGELATAAAGDTVASVASRLGAGAPALIVVDADGAATGVVSAADVLAVAAETGSPLDRRAVGDIQRPIDDFVAPRDPVLDAVQLMRLRKLDCLPVLEDGRPVALVSLASVCDALTRAVEGEFRRAEADIFNGPMERPEPDRDP